MFDFRVIMINCTVEGMGRRLLMMVSQMAVVFMLIALATTFYFAQVTSTKISDDVYNLPYGTTDSHCSSYDYCFDCVQDEGCGFCSEGGTFSNACIPNNDDNDAPTNSSLCMDTNYDASSCPDSSVVGWLIFMFLCLYLLAFAPGMGELSK